MEQQRRRGVFLVIIDAEELGPWMTGPNRLKKTTWGHRQRDIVQKVGDATSHEWASLCRHGPRDGHITMSPGTWSRPTGLIAKAKSSSRMREAIQKVTRSGPRNPHFNGLPDDVHYAFLQYSIEGNHTHGKERFQFAVWSNLEPTLPPFQEGERDWTCNINMRPEDRQRKVLMEPAFVRCLQGHSLVGAVDERVGIPLSLAHCKSLKFAWHGTDANNLHDIMTSELRGTYQKTRKKMKGWEAKNVDKKD